MGIIVKNISEILGKDVFTTKGVYCGRVTNVDINISKYRVASIVIEAAKGSYMENLVGGKKGVIVPYQMVQSIGDIVIIKHIAAPAVGREDSEEAEEASSEKKEASPVGLPF